MLTYEDEIEKQYCRFDLNFAPTDPTRTRIVGKMRERTKCRDHAAAYVGSVVPIKLVYR